ncbi:general secretion pathway protein GspG [Aggregicoccus sp. 17bor-14]|uniref:type II secretion system protein GspG n=1 Tax=Myxococcaceae TaxID=31 RepID=UPI00129CCEF9|nr:type II secretion system protein GspG [Simulacricoccus sp. 17bor-14]MRI90650.1 general secretion pathway protein GspG [Aggregicoccus sp. 17bor-14]
MTSLPAQSPTQSRPRAPRAAQLVLGLVMLSATVLAFAVVYLTNDSTLSPKQRQARGEIRKLDGLFKDFYRMMGRYPSDAEGFTTIVQSGVLKEIPLDPWGRPYHYVKSGKEGHVFSLGEDGMPGGSGDAADLDAGGASEVSRP